MRCGKARRRISDDLDGALVGERRARLDAHLRTCPACRAYREELGRVQAGVRKPASPPAEFWTGFERRLEARLDAAGEGRRRPAGPLAVRRRWVWAAAGAMLLAGMAVWFAFLRPEPAVTETWAAYDDVLDPIVQAAEASPALAARIDREILASIDAIGPAPDDEAAMLPATDPLFLEGLSDDELEAVVRELENETGRGGPK
jgi:anti-sigma factor RsiW